MPIVDFGAPTGTVEFRKSTLGAPVVADSDFGFASSFFGATLKMENRKINQSALYIYVFEMTIQMQKKNVSETREKPKQKQQCNQNTNLSFNRIIGIEEIIILRKAV